MKRLKFKRSNNFVFYVFIAVFICGYAIFLSSKLWMPGGKDLITPTEIGSENSFNERTVKLIRWDYSVEQNICEVELDISDHKFDGVDTYQYIAYERNNGNLEIKKVIDTPNYVVLHISMPKKWKEVSLRMMMPDGSIDSDILKIYGTINSVTYVDDIEEMSELDYQIRRLTDNIVFYEREIDQMEEEIVEETQKINLMNENMEQMEAKKQFQTEQEANETDDLIRSTESEKTSISENIESLNEDIEEYKQRIKNITEQISDLQGNSVEGTDDTTE